VKHFRVLFRELLQGKLDATVIVTDTGNQNAAHFLNDVLALFQDLRE
jgi:hypothetical protein